MGLATDDLVTVSVAGRSVEVPVFVLPGHAEGCGTLYFGYGRRRGGRLATGTSFDVYPLRTGAALWNVADAKVTKSSRTNPDPLVTTQKHFLIEGRNVLRTGTLETFRNDPEFARKMGEAPRKELSLYPPYAYDGYRWGMSIDLNTCTSCSACVVACQAENNIPVVGKDQVSRGRAMHWLRIDRYFEGDPADPTLHNQPVACMHCENAPCEVVCPVAATSHSDEGLNVMTYNRCVGTKYCSNNCPYKVRRFNFLQYSDTTTPVHKMVANPDVTVRNLGVMEKCTYCVQRINRSRIVAERESRTISDGEIRTACQQACPTEAIVFGNTNDKGAKVSLLKAEPLSYGMLEDVNTRPRTTYLARIVNPSPEIAGGAPLAPPPPIAGERS
jgi:molybdopterin-containing oxidoreductase family iron-sulfur binding subunit